ncbi:MAG: hypothetical protein J5589_00275 [Firmicutes bacterium]|nr:hypothetical protein [Bacillota bacterium]
MPAIVSMIAFAFCVPMQILGYAAQLTDPAVVLALVFLPALSAVLMILVAACFGKNHVWLSVFAVFIGVLGFVFKLAMDPRGESLLHHTSAIVLYIGIVGLWALTVFYIIRTKWVLVILFLVPFFKHLLLDDLPVLIGRQAPVPVSMWMKEFSMLSFMLALSFFALALEKTTNYRRVES